MPHKRLSLILLGFGLALGGRAAWAHHSELAEFDPNNLVTVTGTLQKVEWQNPHVWFFVDVTEDDGSVTTWGFSTSPPGILMRRGVTKDVMRIGAVVNVEGRACARRVEQFLDAEPDVRRRYSRAGPA